MEEMKNESNERLRTNPCEAPSTEPVNPVRSATSTRSVVLLPIAAFLFASGGVIAFFIADWHPPVVGEHDPWVVVFLPAVFVAISGCCLLCLRRGFTRVIAVIGILINLAMVLFVWSMFFVMSRALGSMPAAACNAHGFAWACERPGRGRRVAARGGEAGSTHVCRSGGVDAGRRSVAPNASGLPGAWLRFRYPGRKRPSPPAAPLLPKSVGWAEAVGWAEWNESHHDEAGALRWWDSLRSAHPTRFATTRGSDDRLLERQRDARVDSVSG